MKLQKFSQVPKRLKRIPLTIRQIYGHSMMPVLPPGTIVFGWRWYRKLRVGDAVIFWHNDKEKIKRVDKIDGRRVYVLGDHPQVSTDSRQFGWLDHEAVLAKVIWPRAPKDRAENVDSA